MNVIGVRFKSSSRIYYFDPLEFSFQLGDGVIVETARGQEYGEVAQTATEVEDTMIVSPLKPVVRPATDQDSTMREQNASKEGDAFRVCQQKIEQHKLDMRLVSAEYSFNGSKLVFYFTADERVDFRELVKDLASQFRTRIELRQIGVRDEAKMLGGLGPCGRGVCCKEFLDDFHPVSIKMAKEQNLSLSPTKISGLCGRLMCCLQYEQSSYEEMRKRMPHINREIQTPDGVGTVVENNVITEKTKVRLTMPDGSIDVREFKYTMLAKPGEPLPVLQPEPQEQPESAAPPPAAEAAETAEAPRPQPQERNPDHKRRRRGGRGKSGNRPPQTGEPAGVQAGNRPQQPQQGSRPQQPQRSGAQQNLQPQRDGAQQTPQQPRPSGTADGAAKRSSHHRRGGANRPKPQGSAPESKA